MSTYHFNEHRHRFAVWAAARAVQRNFLVKTVDVRKAIERSGLRAFVENEREYSHQKFEIFHMTCACELIECLQNREVKNVSYGRMAKIIAIYLKTAVVLCSKGTCQKSEVIHPPIDSILLKNLAKTVPGLEALAEITWTTLDAESYWQLAECIAQHVGAFSWQLEEYWAV